MHQKPKKPQNVKWNKNCGCPGNISFFTFLNSNMYQDSKNISPGLRDFFCQLMFSFSVSVVMAAIIHSPSPTSLIRWSPSKLWRYGPRSWQSHIFLRTFLWCSASNYERPLNAMNGSVNNRETMLMTFGMLTKTWKSFSSFQSGLCLASSRASRLCSRNQTSCIRARGGCWLARPSPRNRNRKNAEPIFEENFPVIAETSGLILKLQVCNSSSSVSWYETAEWEMQVT